MFDKLSGIGMLALSILLVCVVGFLVVVTMFDEMENNPEIDEIVTPLRLDAMVVVILVTCVVCGVALLVPVKEKDEEDEEKPLS